MGEKSELRAQEYMQAALQQEQFAEQCLAPEGKIKHMHNAAYFRRQAALICEQADD